MQCTCDSLLNFPNGYDLKTACTCSFSCG